MKRLTALLLTCALFAAALTACAQHGADSTSSSAAPSPLSQDALAQPTYPKLASYPNEKDYVKANGDFDSDGFQAAYDAWQADQQKQQPEAAGIMRVMPEKTGNWKRFLSGLTDG